MLKILQATLQQYVNQGLPYVQATFKKGRRTRNQIVNIRGIIEKAREKQTNKQTKKMSASLTMLTPSTVWITANLENPRDRNIRPPHLSLEKPVCRTRSNS